MKLFLSCLYLLVVVAVNAQVPLPNAHAHNDYEHERPLWDALSYGFTSVEADVWLIDGELYVYHNRPINPDPERTLEKLYLRPLKERVEAKGGKVYPGYDDFFYLMIDIKSHATATYEELINVLVGYREMMSWVNEGVPEGDKPIKVFLSGNRPMEVLYEKHAVFGLDGRPRDLGKGHPAHMMPVVSDSFRKFSSWSGIGGMSEADKNKIRQHVRKAHAEGKKVRFWAAPDTPLGWRQLLDLGVDLISTDQLEGFSSFAKSRQ